MQTQIAIVGAGPVGLTLAIDLAQRGVEVCVIEQGHEEDAGDAKCNTVGAKTMEVFRRIGIAGQVRAAGLLDDYPTDAVFTTGFDGHEIARITMPSRDERFGPDGRSAPGFGDSDWLTPEPVVRVSQYFINPILYQYAKTFEKIRLFTGTRFESFEQSEEGVTVFAQNLVDGTSVEIAAHYLIGCDGGRSRVRQQMAVEFEGDDRIGRTRSALVRCAAIRDLFKGRPAWMNWIANSRVNGVCIAINGEDLWLLHRNVPGTVVDHEDYDRDQSIRDLLGVDQSFEWELIQHVDWSAKRLIATHFREGRVFIAGDAAHIWVPMAGYGMNAGIADAENLAWMLAAVLNEYAPESILESHERERQPITDMVSRFAMNKALELGWRSAQRGLPSALDKDGPRGYVSRKLAAKKMLEMHEPQFLCEGLNFGYYYDASPLILYDDESPPSFDMGNATPSTAPGCRLPHFWVNATISIYDQLGPYYTLLQFNGQIMDDAFEAAFARAHLPLKIVEVDANAPYVNHRFLLVRTDQHISWRGDGIPDNLPALVAAVSGRGNA